MIKIISGTKGTGKTKEILNMANLAIDEAKGNIVFLSDTSKYSAEINSQIRFVKTKDYNLQVGLGIIDFMHGMIAGNRDIEYFFIDGLVRITKNQIDEMQEIYAGFEQIANDCNIKIVITVSSDDENIPEFIKKHL